MGNLLAGKLYHLPLLVLQCFLTSAEVFRRTLQQFPKQEQIVGAERAFRQRWRFGIHLEPNG